MRLSERIRQAALVGKSDARPMAARAFGPVELLIIQATPFCNINCEYCYLPDRSNKSILNIHSLSRLLESLQEAKMLGRDLSIVWHAGEPLVLPPSYYSSAIEWLDTKLGGKTRITYHFQTNGLLVSDEYCQLFKRPNVQVALSMDGPAFIHDARRKTRSGGGTHARAMLGLEKLRAHRIPFAGIAVLSKDSLKYPNEIYDFFRENGFQQLGLNLDEEEGSNSRSSLDATDVESEYAAFLRRILFRASSDGRVDWVREFAGAGQTITSLFSNNSKARCSENIPFAIITVGVDGTLYTFSPELAGLEGGAYAIGNINDFDFANANQNPTFIALNNQVQEGVKNCRDTCAYFDRCGGGSPVNKLAENGSFASAETLFCRLKKQITHDVLEDVILERLVDRRKTRRVARVAPTRGGDESETACLWQPGDIHIECESQDGKEHLSLCNGTVRAVDKSYHPDARVPAGDWRSVGRAELARWTHPLATAEGLVRLVRLPADIASGFLELGSKFAAPAGSGRDSMHERGTEALVQRLLKAFAAEGEHKTLGMGINAPGLQTVTKDRGGRQLGLHVDSWYKYRLAERKNAPIRLCVNIGAAPRYFLFLNVSVGAMCRVVGVPGHSEINATDLGRRFMERYPDCPVFRLRVDPGEAYLASTEQLVHDGSSEGSVTPDLSVTVLGRFEARVIS